MVTYHNLSNAREYQKILKYYYGVGFIHKTSFRHIQVRPANSWFSNSCNPIKAFIKKQSEISNESSLCSLCIGQFAICVLNEKKPYVYKGRNDLKAYCGIYIYKRKIILCIINIYKNENNNELFFLYNTVKKCISSSIIISQHFINVDSSTHSTEIYCLF